MKIVKHFILTILALSNGLIGIAFLVCAYSPYISPVEHPVGACAGLFFPIFMCLNLAFCFVWLCLKPWGVCLPLLFFAAAWNSLRIYFPVGSIKEGTPGAKNLKFLTYNTQGIAAGEKGKPTERILYWLICARVGQTLSACKSLCREPMLRRHK